MPSKFETCPHLGTQGLLRAVASHEETQPEEQSLEVVSSRMLLEGMVSKQIMRYDGWLIRTADEKRTFEVIDYTKSPSKRSLTDDDKIQKDVVDIVLADDIGPFMVSLWGRCVESFLEQSSRIEDHSVNQFISLSAVSISTLPERDWNGLSLFTI